MSALFVAGGGPIVAHVALLADAAKATPETLSAAGVQVEHHFCGDKPGWKPYIHEARMPAGRMVGQHMHKHDHLAVLVSGHARLWVDGKPLELKGYCVPPTLEAGHSHAIEAVTDCIWLCVWATNVDDPAAIDAGIMEG